MPQPQRHIVFLINPISGTKSKKHLTSAIETFCNEHQLNYEIQHTQPDADYSTLKSQIQTKKVTDVIVCGGDGSISQVTEALKDTGVVFGIIPAGSGNGLARAAHIPIHIKGALHTILENHYEQVDGFIINNRFSCMLSGLGFDARIAHNFSQKKTRGLLSYITETVKHFFNAHPYHFKIELHNRTHEVESYFISIANSNQFGNEVTIAPKAHLNDGLLDIVVVTNMNKFRMLWSLVKQIKAGKVQTGESGKSHNGIFYFQTPRLVITNYNRAPLHIDGDPVETAEKINIEVLPKAFKLLIPSSVLL